MSLVAENSISGFSYHCFSAAPKDLQHIESGGAVTIEFGIATLIAVEKTIKLCLAGAMKSLTITRPPLYGLRFRTACCATGLTADYIVQHYKPSAILLSYAEF